MSNPQTTTPITCESQGAHIFGHNGKCLFCGIENPNTAEVMPSIVEVVLWLDKIEREIPAMREVINFQRIGAVRYYLAELAAIIESANAGGGS